MLKQWPIETFFTPLLVPDYEGILLRSLNYKIYKMVRKRILNPNVVWNKNVNLLKNKKEDSKFKS